MYRPARAALRTALTWSVTWGLFGLALGAARVALLHAFDVSGPAPLPVLLLPALRWALYGMVAGGLFALALRRAGRRLPTVHALSRWRAAAWGAGAGALLPLAAIAAMLALGGPVWPLALVLGLIAGGGILGGSTAAAMVALAQRDPAALPSGPRQEAIARPTA